MPAKTNATKREGEKENGQRQKERKKKKFSRREKKSQTSARKNIKETRLFSSHLRRFCTRRWLLFGTARLPRRPRSSVRLSICPSFSWFVCSINDDRIRVLFPSFLEKVRERSERKRVRFS